MRWLTAVLLFSLATARSAFAVDLSVVIRDKSLNPVENAVVIAVPLDKKVNLKPKSAPARLIQENQEFSPMVTVIQKGENVIFPNKDAFNHHVYSISKIKKFELPLYKKSDKLPDPVRFEKSGVVVVGCNIHDEMIAYIIVVESPHFAKTLDGQTELKGLVPGKYRIDVWHPSLGEKMKVVNPGLDLTQPPIAVLNIEI